MPKCKSLGNAGKAGSVSISGRKPYSISPGSGPKVGNGTKSK